LRGLRVRIKELAQEAKFIKFEENRIKRKRSPTNEDYEDLYKLQMHRRYTVRQAARAAQLAYAFLRGIPYREVEPNSQIDDWLFNHLKKEIKRLTSKFGYGNFDSEVDDWFN